MNFSNRNILSSITNLEQTLNTLGHQTNSNTSININRPEENIRQKHYFNIKN